MIQILNWIVEHPIAAPIIWVMFMIGLLGTLRELGGMVYAIRRNR